jgi:hypothetical protein
MWSWVLSIIGIVGMIMVGRKMWQAFVVLISVEILWVVYSIQTRQYGFILGATAYITVHAINTRRWRRDSRRNRSIR